jgi:hypothetical protein
LESKTNIAMEKILDTETWLILKPAEIRPDLYLPYFMDYKIGNFSFKAIDPLFLKLLEEKTSSMGNVIIKHQINPNDSRLPTGYLQFRQENRLLLCLSAKEIMWYFLQHKKELSERNFFVLKIDKEFKIIDIKFLGIYDGKKKYFLYPYLYSQWGTLLRNMNGNSLSLVVPYKDG